MVGSKFLGLLCVFFFLGLAGFYLTSSVRKSLQKVTHVLYNSLLNRVFWLQVNFMTRVSPQWIRPSLFVVSSDHDTAIGFALFFTLYSLCCLCLSGATVIIFTIKNVLFPDAQIKVLYCNANKLPLLNRVLLLVFTLTFSIPNRVWVKSGNSKYWWLRVIIMFFLLICTHILPIFYGVVWYMFCFITESYIFARVYETYPWFKNLILTYLFAADKEFAA